MHIVKNIDSYFLSGKSEFALDLMDAFIKVSDRFSKSLERESSKLSLGSMEDNMMQLEFTLRNQRVLALLLAFRGVGEYYNVAFDHQEAIGALEQYFSECDAAHVVDLKSAITAKVRELHNVRSPMLELVPLNSNVTKTQALGRLKVVK